MSHYKKLKDTWIMSRHEYKSQNAKDLPLGGGESEWNMSASCALSTLNLSQFGQGAAYAADCPSDLLNNGDTCHLTCDKGGQFPNAAGGDAVLACTNGTLQSDGVTCTDKKLDGTFGCQDDGSDCYHGQCNNVCGDDAGGLTGLMQKKFCCPGGKTVQSGILGLTWCQYNHNESPDMTCTQNSDCPSYKCTNGRCQGCMGAGGGCSVKSDQNPTKAAWEGQLCVSDALTDYCDDNPLEPRCDPTSAWLTCTGPCSLPGQYCVGTATTPDGIQDFMGGPAGWCCKPTADNSKLAFQKINKYPDCGAWPWQGWAKQEDGTCAMVNRVEGGVFNAEAYETHVECDSSAGGSGAWCNIAKDCQPDFYCNESTHKCSKKLGGCASCGGHDNTSNDAVCLSGHCCESEGNYCSPVPFVPYESCNKVNKQICG